MKLVLFDVDGILVESGSVKYDYWKAVVKRHFNLDTDRKYLYTEGKTDREILFEHLKNQGIENPEGDKRFSKALDDIGNVASEAIRKLKIKKIRNVEELIKMLLADGNFTIGLLTGNTRSKAKAKLENCGLWGYFQFGAFGNATRIRSDLVGIAIEEAKRETGADFEKKDVYLVGDTVRDIQCARQAGVKVIAISTGKEDVKTLEKERPDYLFKDFSNPSRIIAKMK